MGIFRKNVVEDIGASSTSGLASPWSNSGNLALIAASDFWDVDLSAFPLSRLEALGLPAVSKARNLLISTIAPVPLRALKDGVALDNQPTWLYRSDSNVSPFERLAATIDDLVFFGNCLWNVSRGTDGAILDAVYVPRGDWSVSNGRILIEDKPVDESEVIFFNSPFEGLLTIAARKLREGRDVEVQIAQKVANPIPLTVIRWQDGNDSGQLEQDEITAILTAYRSTTRAPEGAAIYLPAGLTIETHGESDPALFLEERNAFRTDIASFLGIPSYMLDGSLNTSFTYNTSSGTRDRFYAESLPFWTEPITSRLSQDDCVPRGTSVAFDFTNTYAAAPSPTGPELED